jgi:iron complex transport system ATP-binding protein
MLSVRDLHVSYGDTAVLRGVDLEARPGEVVALVGPNGCGKTTLIRAITRVLPWTSGDVLAGETSLVDLRPRDLARLIAVVPQNPQLPLGYTALDVVLMGRTPHLGFFDQEGPSDLRLAWEAIERVGVAHLAHRRVDELSGGERQNVVLARALAQDTPILLLDEPTANLDVGHQMSVAVLVRRLAASGLAVLAAIHDLTLASLYSDRVVLMTAGRVLSEGRPTEILTGSLIRAAYGADVTVLPTAGRGPVIVPLEPDR